jgi:hypothetical protein
MTYKAHNLCGYRVIDSLREDCTYLAAGPGGRHVVLKRLESDCLLRRRLHPSVRERLERVRELAHAGVANLHGVGREGESDANAWLIWEYLPGDSFDAYAADPARSRVEVRGMARELALTVDSLHQQGIVHGALVPGNVRVSPAGDVRITHVSPLLFTDPSVDGASVLALLEHVLDRRGEREGPLGLLLAEARSAEWPLAMLASRLAAEPVAATGALASEREAAPTRRARRQALAAAVVVTAIALTGGMFLWRRLDPRPATPAQLPPGTEISIRH